MTPVPELLNRPGAQAILDVLRQARPRQDVNQPKDTGEAS
jgi:hypothetical protein